MVKGLPTLDYKHNCLEDKGEALKSFSRCCKERQRLLYLPIVSFRSDHGRKFNQLGFGFFCETYAKTHNVSALGTPKQNSVVERKNDNLEKKIARTMLIENGLAK